MEIIQCAVCRLRYKDNICHTHGICPSLHEPLRILDAYRMAIKETLNLLYLQKNRGVQFVRTRAYQYRSDRSTGKQGFIAGYTGIFPCNWGTPPYQHSEWGIEVAKDTFVCYSSTTRNRNDKDAGTNGVRKILEHDLLRHPENWDVYEKRVAIDIAIERLIRAEWVNGTGAGYDWGGIAGFGAIPFLNDPFKWYCSEEVYYIEVGKRRRVISPRQLTKVLKKRGYQLIRQGERKAA